MIVRDKKTQNYLDACWAVRIVDSAGKENREQAAIRILRDRGYYEGLNEDESRDLDSAVRLACEDIAPPEKKKPTYKFDEIREKYGFRSKE